MSSAAEANVEVVRDEAFGRRYAFRNIAKVVPALIGLALLWRDWGRFDWGFWASVASFVGGIGWWAWQDRQLLRTYRCPRCRDRLPRTSGTPAEGEPVRFECRRCGVAWDTTLSW